MEHVFFIVQLSSYSQLLSKDTVITSVMLFSNHRITSAMITWAINEQKIILENDWMEKPIAYIII